MKIRLDFVSNSSSSSFCILGKSICDENDIVNFVKNLDFSSFKEDIQIIDDYIIIDGNEYGYYDFYYALTKLFEDNNLDLEIVYGVENYRGQYIIGINPSKMKDDQTLADFKEKIIEALKKINVKDIEASDLRWYVDGGFEG